MRSPYSQERQDELKKIQPESVEEFLARGGKITDKTRKVKKVNKVDAQQLLDTAIGTPYEKEVITFLASQGIDVQ